MDHPRSHTLRKSIGGEKGNRTPKEEAHCRVAEHLRLEMKRLTPIRGKRKDLERGPTTEGSDPHNGSGYRDCTVARQSATVLYCREEME